jgi:hypothetical protein
MNISVDADNETDADARVPISNGKQRVRGEQGLGLKNACTLWQSQRFRHWSEFGDVCRHTAQCLFRFREPGLMRSRRRSGPYRVKGKKATKAD